MKQFDPARAADEASHAAAALGSSLLNIEIGNEPDLYPQYSNNAAQYVPDAAALRLLRILLAAACHLTSRRGATDRLASRVSRRP